MNLPEPMHIVKLSEMLPPIIAFKLQIEFDDFVRRGQGHKLKDEASVRYIYMGVLGDFGIECPHPYRTYFTTQDQLFECRLCRAYVVPTKEY